MRSSVRSRIAGLVRAQWAGLLALFLVIAGGTAYAANTIGSADIIDESIASVDLKNGQVKSPDIGNNQVRSADVRELSQFTEAASGGGTCTDDAHTGATCASASITLERPGKLLLNATSEWHTANLDDTSGPGSDTDNTTWVEGSCRLLVDGTTIGNPQDVGERVSPGMPNHPFGGTMALTGLSGSLAAAPHTVIVRCDEVDGDIDWSEVNLTAALVAD